MEQRHATAVVYFNEPGDEFSGGELQFQDGSFKRVSPSCGSMVRIPSKLKTRGSRLLLCFQQIKREHQSAAQVLHKSYRDQIGLLNSANSVELQVTFLADDSNIHRVTQVEHGERLTLTLWFTLLLEHSEDEKVLQLLAQSEGESKDTFMCCLAA